MITVTVSASQTYNVVIGSSLLANAGKYIKAVKSPCAAVIISNETVWPLHGQPLHDSLTDAGFHVLHYLIGDGEDYKNSNTYFAILSFLAENKLTRGDLIVALGGGVVGDITGFAAATYLRGIDYIQIPTTLLAMVDSSVGGKTAIDLPQGKNLAGAFYQPKLVLCDTGVLETLPAEVFCDGCAEVIKYGVLFDPALFSHLCEHGTAFQKEYVISRCVQWKRDVVAQDEFDTGLRQKLNLGHTIGHAIEKQSQFAISHGRAVALGMAIIAKAFGSKSLYTAICAVLKRFSLPCRLPDSSAYAAENIYNAALSDKKRTGSTVNLIVPLEIGNCEIRSTNISDLLPVIEKGLL